MPTGPLATIVHVVAKKARTPPPPRRVQAPRTRVDDGGGSDRRRWAILAGVVALGLVALAAVLALLAFSDESEAAEIILRDEGCVLQTAPGQGQRHITAPLPKFKYKTFPPTSGPHNPEQPPFGVFGEPVEQYRLLHNLEHGGVVIQYGKDIPQAQVDELLAWYRDDDPNGLVVAPLPRLNDEIVLTAWTGEPVEQGEEAGAQLGYLARCPEFTERGFAAFVREYGFRGPERYPRDFLTPGT